LLAGRGEGGEGKTERRERRENRANGEEGEEEEEGERGRRGRRKRRDQHTRKRIMFEQSQDVSIVLIKLVYEPCVPIDVLQASPA
jgi:hypothetical protein